MIPDFLRSALAPDTWPSFVFIATRLTGLMLTAPLWSMSAMPRQLRAAIIVLLTLALLPSAPPFTLPASVIELPLPLVFEMVIGIAIGLTGAVVVQGVALAGEIVSLQMGLSLGPVLAPTPDLQVSGVGQLKTVLALLVYVAMDGHLVLLRGLADSLQALPPGMPLAFGDDAQPLIRLVGTLFSGGVQVAAPAMAALLLANVAMAILSRAVPQLNAMMVAFPVSIGVGLVIVGASVPILTGAIGRWFEGMPAGVDGILTLFQGDAGAR